MFWQIASIILSVVQLGLYLSGVDKYKDKLIDLATWLCDSADLNRTHYETFRNLDPDFYSYYQTLPNYSECNSAIHRSKGAAFYGYGSRVRRARLTGRGFTPLSKVHVNNMVASDAVAQSAVTMAVTNIRERDRVNAHNVERWSAIASAPVAVERYQPAIINGIVRQSFKSLKGFGQGFNSAGVALGTQLHNLLN